MSDGQPVPAEILDEMVAYYRARAPKYDAWFASPHDGDHRALENAPWSARASGSPPRDQLGDRFAVLANLQNRGVAVDFDTTGRDRRSPIESD